MSTVERETGPERSWPTEVELITCLIAALVIPGLGSYLGVVGWGSLVAYGPGPVLLVATAVTLARRGVRPSGAIRVSVGLAIPAFFALGVGVLAGCGHVHTCFP